MVIDPANLPYVVLWTVLTCAGFAVSLFFVGRLIARQKTKRSRALHQVAKAQKLDFHAEFWNTNNLKLAMSGSFSLFDFQKPEYLENVFQGANDQFEMTVFDYGYQYPAEGKIRAEGSLVEGTMVSLLGRQTVGFFKIAGLNLPKFRLHPNGFLGTLSEMLGLADINFKYYPRFSSQFSLKGRDETAVRNLFHQDTLLHYFEHHPDLCVEGQGNELICYRARHRVKPREMDQFVQKCCEIAHLLAYKTLETDPHKLIPRGRQIFNRVRAKIAEWRL